MEKLVIHGERLQLSNRDWSVTYAACSIEELVRVLYAFTDGYRSNELDGKVELKALLQELYKRLNNLVSYRQGM